MMTGRVMEELTRHERLDLEDVDPFHLRRVLSRTLKLLVRMRPEQACNFLLHLHERGFPLPPHVLQACKLTITEAHQSQPGS